MNDSCETTACGCPDGGANSESRGFEAAKLAAGAAFFAAGIVLPRFFTINLYAVFSFFLVSYIILGAEIIFRAGKNIIRGRVFDENFLMGAATAGAFIIGEWPEAAAVMLFYQVGEFLQETAVRKSKRSVSALMAIRPDYANIVDNGETVRVAPETVKVGDVILIKPGERVPLDGVIVEGVSILDTSALTGESFPKRAAAADTVLSGSINMSGALTVRVTKTFGESAASRIVGLVEGAMERKAPAERFITKFARIYTPIVVGLAVLISAVPPLLSGGGWRDWIGRGLIFLVISCPCALVISIPLSFFGGIGGASRKGVLVKGGNYLEALADLDIAVFDKTGTLTKGVFKVTAVQTANGFTEDEAISLAAHAEAFSNHPIALSVLRHHNREIDRGLLTEYAETPGFGVGVKLGGKTVLAGNLRHMGMNGVACEGIEESGTESVGKAASSVYIAVDGICAGRISISDEIKPGSRSAISALRSLGVRKIVMLTGDAREAAAAAAGELGIDEVYGELLPSQKVELLETLERQKHPKGTLAFVGDGINDAPVLARADVGVAVAGPDGLGSDAAIEAADAVLMAGELSGLIGAIGTARFTKRVVKQNIAVALGVKVLFLLMGAIGFAAMWEAVFADVGVALVAVLNAARILRH